MYFLNLIIHKKDTFFSGKKGSYFPLFIFKIFLLIVIFFFPKCAGLFTRSSDVNDISFAYERVSSNYFGPENEKPFPLTIQRGNNMGGEVTGDGRFLYYTGDSLGNLNLYIRDLRSSITFPLTLHSSADYKPAVTKDGKKLAFVSERIDSLGDIYIVNLNTEKWVENILKGQVIADTFELLNITNREYYTKNIVKRNIDTDPVWSPDGRYLAYVSDENTQGITNIFLSDSKNNYSTRILTEYGASSPSFSPDGKFIYFISYRDNPEGEVYKIEIASKKEERITNDSNMDLYPSISSDGNFLIYTSIRNDTDKNGKLSPRDNAYIIKKNLKNGVVQTLTAGNYSLFDTKYSNFIGGSVIFSAPIDGSINVYFIPISGEIPKTNSIQRQYELADKYRSRSSEYVRFAYQSLDIYFSNDNLYPLFRSRSDRQIVKDLESEGRENEANALLESMLSTKLNPKSGFSYALAIGHQARKKGYDPVPKLLDYYEEFQSVSDAHPEIPPSILHWIGEMYEDSGRLDEANGVYQKIFDEYPKFYRIEDVKISLGINAFQKNPSNIPEIILDIYSEKLIQKNAALLVQELSKKISSLGDISTQKSYLEKYLSDENLKNRNSQLYGLISYFYARVLRQEDKFIESSDIINSYVNNVKKGSFPYLGGEYLLYENLRDIGDEERSREALLDFLKNYESRSGYTFDPDTIESNLLNIESGSKKYELTGKKKESLINYSKNAYILSIAIEKKIPIGELYEEYSTYYNRKMIDTALNVSIKDENSNLSNLLDSANFLTGNKVDLLGKTTGTLSGLLNFKIVRFFGDFRDLNFISTNDSDIFEIPQKFYDERKEVAQQTLDYGTIYGYSYLLITKAVNRENIYLEKKALTESRKKKILQELKEAELNLRWILYANPSFSEAYLLLGWLHQYIDLRKNSIPDGEEKKESELFESLYTKFFPLKYLEENVELYREILEIKEKSSNKKLVSDLNLNLGNTFFLLNDFENAQRHYKRVELLSPDIISNVQFETYKQKSFYLYNYARSKIYTGDTKSAIGLLSQAIDIYYKEEYYPIIAKMGTKNQSDSISNSLTESRKKLALLHTLKGLAELEVDDFPKAILSFSTALSMNGDTDFINDLGLYNSLALCYQKIGDYKKSEEVLKKSDEEYIRRDNRLKKLLSFSFWDLAFPENLRVIGEGRFPGELSSDFHNLITRGIRIKNAADNREYTTALSYIEERSNFIKKNSLNKNTMGKKILEKEISDIAFREYERGNFLKASELYTKDYQEKIKRGELTEAFRAYLRSDMALFSHIEENPDNTESIREELRTNLKFLNKFRNEKENECHKNFPIEIYGLTYCKQEFLKSYPDYEISLANNYFYSAELAYQFKNIEEAMYYYSLSASIATNPGNLPKSEIGLEKDPFSIKERCRLKITAAISQLRMGESSKFLEFLKEASYMAGEIQLEYELLYIQLLEAEYYISQENSEKSINLAADKILKIENILSTQVGLWYTIPVSFLKNFYSLQYKVFIRKKQMEKLSGINEKLFSAILFKKILTNEFKFQDEKLFLALNEFQYLTQKDRELQDTIEKILNSRKEPKLVLEERSKNLTRWNKRILELQKIFPTSMDFVSWNPALFREKKPIIENNTLLLELFTDNQSVHLQVRDSNKKHIIHCNLSNLGSELGDYLKERPGISTLVISRGLETYSTKFQDFPYKDKTIGDFFKIRYIFRVGQYNRSVQSEFSRLRRISITDNPLLKNSKEFINPTKNKDLNFRIFTTDNLKNFLSDTDILEGSLDYSNPNLFLGEKKSGTIQIKEVIESQWNIPLLIINNYEDNETNYIKTGFLYDILSLTGVQSIILLDKSKELDKKRAKLLSNLRNINDVVQNEKLTLIGDTITPYPENQTLFEEEFRKFTELGKKEERNKNNLESMKFFLLANSVLPDNRPDLQIDSELNLIRMKKKLYPEFEPFEELEKLLNLFQNDSVEAARVLFNFTIDCYENNYRNKCNKYYDSLINNSKSSSNEKLILSYYKALQEGNLKFIIENKNNFTQLKYHRDEYLCKVNLSSMYSDATLWKEGIETSDEALKLAGTQIEIESAKLTKADVYLEYFFINGVEADLVNKERPLYYGKNKLWKDYNDSVNRLLQKENDTFKQEYLSRIYKSYEDIEKSPDFQPISLSPSILKNGKPSLYLLKDTDRLFLFYLLQKSIPFQIGNELNNQFDLLYSTEEDLKNQNRANWMKLIWSLSLFTRGDTKTSLKYFNELDSNVSDSYMEDSFQVSYLLLKYKLSKTSDLQISRSERENINNLFNDYYKYYEKAETLTLESEYYNLVNSLIKDKRINKLDENNIREFQDFLTYLQREGLEKNNWSMILNISYYKEVLAGFDPKIISKPTFSDLPQIAPKIAENIQARIPTGQEFIGIIDIGIQSYRISIDKSAISGKEIFTDNRYLKNLIIDYLNSTRDYGENSLVQKYIEELYRAEIKLKQNTLTYLYLPSYHFKVYLHPNESDHFYYVLNLSEISSKKTNSYHREFKAPFKFQVIGKSQTGKKAVVHKMIEMETKLIPSSPGGKEIFIHLETLELKNDSLFHFHNKPLRNLKGEKFPRGFWYLGGLELASTFTKYDDLTRVYHRLDELSEGPGVLSMGLQEDTNSPFFLREFLKKEGPDSFFERYTDAMSALKKRFKEDRYWNGFRPYTNTFLLEKLNSNLPPNKRQSK